MAVANQRDPSSMTLSQSQTDRIVADAWRELVSLSPSERRMVQEAMPYTMTNVSGLLATVDAVKYVVARQIPGSIVECGVWKGGSVLAMVRTLQGLGVTDRDLYLLDTFEGMTEPTEVDTSFFHKSALATWSEAQAKGERAWVSMFDDEILNVDSVRDLISSTGYPEDRIHFIVGPVEETIPDKAPDVIGLLRLDTDWYQSTHHELCHLYPRLSDGGVLIVDDYGHWDGSRRAVDEFFSSDRPRPFLSRIDYAARIGVKS